MLYCTVATVATVTHLFPSLGGYPGRRADVTGVGDEGCTSSGHDHEDDNIMDLEIMMMMARASGFC